MSLGQRFDCAGVIYETNFQVRRDSNLFVPHPSEFPTVADYQEFMTPKESWSVETARADLQQCYRRYCSGSSRVVIDKGPDINLLRAAFLQQCFPESPFVLIFRDPVANVEGLRRKWEPFRSEPLESTIRFWASIHEAYLEAVERMPGRAHAVEYEALVADPDATLAALAERLDLAPARKPRALATQANVEGQGIRNVLAGEIGYLTDANQRARDRLENAEVELIEAELNALEQRIHRAPFTLTREVLGIGA